MSVLRSNHWVCSDCLDGLRDIADVRDPIASMANRSMGLSIVCCACGGPCEWVVRLVPPRELPCFSWTDDGNYRQAAAPA